MKKAPREPSWTELHRLGVEAAKELEPLATYAEIGAEIGVTKQNAYHEVVLALGKLVWRVQKRLRLR